jgi:large subunit ribosomal protein L10
MNKTEKRDVVGALATMLKSSANVYLTDFTGISVKGMTDLRRRFRAHGVQYRVVKNTLALRALKDTDVIGLDALLTGPTAVVFAGEDPVGAAKVLAEFQKESEDRPAVKAAWVEGRAIGPNEVKRLANLPTRDQLLAQLAGAWSAPLSGFVTALGGLLYQFAGSLEALRAQREGA